MRSRSRACKAALARSRRYLRSTPSMNAERECFEPARRSTLFKTSLDSVIEVFSFILPSYYHCIESRKARSQPGKEENLIRIFCYRAGKTDGGDLGVCQEIDSRCRRAIAEQLGAAAPGIEEDREEDLAMETAL